MQQQPIVLVVEDHPDSRESLALLLEQTGYAPATASDGQEALEYLRAGPRPCLILLDLMMPRMDGLAFLAEQSKDPHLSQIPVAILSAYFEMLEAGAQGNVVATVRKPVEWSQLLGVIRQVCPLPPFRPHHDPQPD
jgi:CheY-like chemotaxis protein